MPEMNGFEFLKSVKERGLSRKDTEFVLSSASSESIVGDYQEAGFSVFRKHSSFISVQKPISRSALESLIKSLKNR